MKRARSRPHRGVALMLALWLIVALGAIAAQVTAAAREESALVRNVKARTAARYAAESGLIAARAQIESLLASAVLPAERTRRLNQMDDAVAALRNVDIGAARFTVAAADLNARIDLNQAGDATLLAFFGQFTTDREARVVVDALGDWKDADSRRRAHGAETQEYERAGSRWVPRNAPLEWIEELRRVHGVSEQLARAVAPYVTVGGDGRVNLNTAPESVLAAVPRLGSAGARAIVSRRRAGQPFTSTTIITQLLGRGGRPGVRGDALGDAAVTGAAVTGAAGTGARLGIEPSRLLLVSRGWLPGHPLTREIQAVFAVQRQRLVLQSWRERDL